MDPATIIQTTLTVIKYGNQVFEYIRDDQNARLGLIKPVRMVIDGPGVGIGSFKSPDGLFEMISPTINRIEFIFLPFAADKDSPWNGPDGLPNTWPGGALPASLPHDFICKWRQAIAKKLEFTEDEVWVWASGILSTVWKHYGGDDVRTYGESWLSYYVTRFGRRPYAWFKRRFGFMCLFVAVCVASGCTGCPRPDWNVTYADPVISIESGVVTTNTLPR